MTYSTFINVEDLRLGMYVQLDLSWLQHPFPVGSFVLQHAAQVETLKSLGLHQVRCIPDKSWPGAFADVRSEQADIGDMELSSPDSLDAGAHSRRSDCVSCDAEVLEVCNQRFNAASTGYQRILSEVDHDPCAAMVAGHDLVSSYIADLLDTPYTAIRVLSDSVGEQEGAHSVTVTVLALLLGKSRGLTAERLLNLGLAALMHDIGKRDLELRCTEHVPGLSAQEQKCYESHVEASVAYGARMGLPSGALAAIAQHHESDDGAGFPLRLTESALSEEGKILSLVNCYDKLCNPAASVVAMTPHEAISALFTQRKGYFSRTLVESFVRVMGVYPPGTVVQLSDGRYGLVTSVNSAQPLRPSVLVYEPDIARERAEPLDLSITHGVVVKRSVRPAQLPREVSEYLSPRKRVCYFFERAISLGLASKETAV